jgi:hypothetical protein
MSENLRPVSEFGQVPDGHYVFKSNEMLAVSAYGDCPTSSQVTDFVELVERIVASQWLKIVSEALCTSVPDLRARVAFL